MARARLLVREKTIYENGDILEVVVWGVPAGPRAPSGVRYRLAFVRRGDPEPAVLYDNHSPKGHHRHIDGVEELYEFFDVDRLLDDFVTDVRRVTGDDEWPRR